MRLRDNSSLLIMGALFSFFNSNSNSFNVWINLRDYGAGHCFIYLGSTSPFFTVACAAESLATGTLNGEHET